MLTRRGRTFPSLAMPYITFKEQSRPVGPGVLTIGGGHEASWRIPGFDLAPLHAIVAPEREGRAVIMRGSPFARVFINGVEMDTQTRPLAFGDVIRLGGAELRYVESSRQGAGKDGYLCDVRHNRVFKLGDRNAIGRDLKCNVLLSDTTASRTHADVMLEDGQYVLRPSGGVTFVNGRHVAEPVPLRDGDEIGVGRSALRFSREMPSYASEAKTDSDTRASYAGRRSAQVQTTFMGVVEQREQLRRQQSRRLGRMAALVISAAVVISAIASAIYGRRTANAAAGGRQTQAQPQAVRTNAAAAGIVAPPATAADSVRPQGGADSVSSPAARSRPQ